MELLLVVFVTLMFIGIVFMIFAVTIFFIIKSTGKFQKKTAMTFQELAHEFKGKYHEAGPRFGRIAALFQGRKALHDFSKKYRGGYYPALSFPVKGGEGIVLFQTTGTEETLEYWTDIVITLDKPFGKNISVCREGYIDKFTKLLGAQDIQVGDSEFNRRFIIKSDDEIFALNKLDIAARKIINRISMLTRGYSEVRVGSNIFIRINGFLDEKGKIREYLILAMDLCRHFIRSIDEANL